jgi:hypothetical protein
MNTANTMTSLKAEDTKPAARASRSPMASPPTRAPGRLPKPPRTAAATPLIIIVVPPVVAM